MTFQILDLHQGSAEWLAHRAAALNASDAPAMMGCSKYKTRAALVREHATGITPEVDADTQRRFDDGHRFEELARPLAEEIIGEELSPLVGTNGRYSASFDGITFGGDTIFEHKTLNMSLGHTPWDQGNGDHLPLQYRYQMEHQLMVSGAERALFMASKWDSEGQLIEERHCWYVSDNKLRDQLIAGWDQFEQDVAAYRANPPEQAAPVVADPVESLPAVSVRVDGALAIASNLDVFGSALRAFVERIPEKPATDQEFANCDAACKALKRAEDALESAEDGALAQISDVETMRRTVADLRNLARTTRLRVEKLVAAEKDARKAKIVQDAQNELDLHIADLNRQLGANWLPRQNAGFGEAIKGLKSLDSMRDKVAVALSNAKLEATTKAHTLTLNRDFLRGDGQDWITLFPDFASVGAKEPEDFQALAALRISQHRQAEAARLEKERERIRAEEEAKAKREADEALRKRLAESEAKVQQSIAEAKQEGVMEASLLDDLSAVHKDLTADVISDIDARRVIGEARASAAQVEGDTVTLGQLNALLAPIRIDAAGLADLGFTPRTTVKAAKHYACEDVPRICRSLIQRLQGLLATA